MMRTLESHVADADSTQAAAGATRPSCHRIRCRYPSPGPRARPTLTDWCMTARMHCHAEVNRPGCDCNRTFTVSSGWVMHQTATPPSAPATKSAIPPAEPTVEDLPPFCCCGGPVPGPSAVAMTAIVCVANVLTSPGFVRGNRQRPSCALPSPLCPPRPPVMEGQSVRRVVAISGGTGNELLTRTAPAIAAS